MPINSHRILVVGGAGYIGSHMVLALQQAGYPVVVVDNLSKGYRDAVLGDVELVVGDIANESLLEELFQVYRFSAVMHFASFIEVGESVNQPVKYYENNVSATLTLLKVMLKHQVRQFIFSSTAAVYGEPQYTPIDEAHPLAPINPYGRSKMMVENILQDLAKSDGLQYGILRYFNAAGADPAARLGEHHDPETHLIPLVLQAAAGLREHITIYGCDYPTPDGTCIRDYVHVTDICDAHLLALQALFAGKPNMICNLGSGHGFSVLDVIESAKRVTGRSIKVEKGVRRAGDPAVLVADAALAKRAINWQPNYIDLDTIVMHAWEYMRRGVNMSGD